MTSLRFVLTGLSGFAVCVGAYLGLFSVALRQPVSPYHWLRNVYLVKDRLAAEAPAPRWLLIGGSSVWFGYRSDIIERATGAHVVNLGNHAELPLEFQFWEAAHYLKRGDTVLLAPEFTYFWRERPYTTYSATEIALMAPAYVWEASWRQKRELFATVPPLRIAEGLVSRWAGGSARYAEKLMLPTPDQLMTNLQARLEGRDTSPLPNLYHYLELNRNGDMARPREPVNRGHFDYDLQVTHPQNNEVWRVMAEFTGRMKARGVRCLFTWQPLERSPRIDYTSPIVRANFDLIRRSVSEAGWRVLGEPEDAIMGADFFYDTPHHLTTEGARRRTERLVERLREAGLATH